MLSKKKLRSSIKSSAIPGSGTKPLAVDNSALNCMRFMKFLCFEINPAIISYFCTVPMYVSPISHSFSFRPQSHRFPLSEKRPTTTKLLLP